MPLSAPIVKKLILLEYLKIGSNGSQLFTIVRNVLLLTFLKTRYHVNITEGIIAENTNLGSALKFFFVTLVSRD